MKNIKNNIYKFIIVAICFITIVPNNAFAAQDKTVYCDGRPKWDRFIVDEKTTKWDPSSAKCYEIKSGKKHEIANPALYGTPAMYGNETDGHVYSVPATYGMPVNDMYGEYNDLDKTALYGKYNDSDNRYLYGRYNPDDKGVVRAATVKSGKPAPIRAAGPVPITGKIKQNIKPKPVAPKKVPVKVPKIIGQDSDLSLLDRTGPMPLPTVIPIDVPAVMPKSYPINPNAKGIAKSLESGFDIESYCISKNPAVKGPLPKGLVLMPGRTDLMSCVIK